MTALDPKVDDPRQTHFEVHGDRAKRYRAKPKGYARRVHVVRTLCGRIAAVQDTFALREKVAVGCSHCMVIKDKWLEQPKRKPLTSTRRNALLRLLAAGALAILAACGPAELEEPQPPPLPAVVVGATPNGLEVLPPGWFLHLYPALCVVLVRDADGYVRRCFDFYPEPCAPTDARACAPFPVGSR